jgi:hypothetical protein
MTYLVPDETPRRSQFPQAGEVFLLTMQHADSRGAGLVWTTGLGCALYSTSSMSRPIHVSWQEAQELIWQARHDGFRISHRQLDGILPSSSRA